jgi:hypothetical protein
MTSIDTLAERNATFAAQRFSADLSINPSGRLML